MILTCHGQLVKNQCINRSIDMNDKDIIIALPKGRILKQVLPIFNKIGITPEKSFFNDVSSAHLQKGHPLAHLATSFRSIQQHPPGGFDKSSNAHTLNPYSNQPNLNKVFATKSVRDEKGNQRMQRDFFLNSSSKHHREFLLSTCVLGSISTCVSYL